MFATHAAKDFLYLYRPWVKYTEQSQSSLHTMASRRRRTRFLDGAAAASCEEGDWPSQRNGFFRIPAGGGFSSYSSLSWILRTPAMNFCEDPANFWTSEPNSVTTPNLRRSRVCRWEGIVPHPTRTWRCEHPMKDPAVEHYFELHRTLPGDASGNLWGRKKAKPCIYWKEIKRKGMVVWK